MKVKQPYDGPRQVPWLDDRVVKPGEVVDVPPTMLAGFVEAGWTPADPATKKAAAELAKPAEQSDAMATALRGALSGMAVVLDDRTGGLTNGDR